MEVHIRNVPAQATDNGLKRFLKPHLHKLSIQSYHCQKQNGRTYASLTFLYLRDGERFLAHHGQVKIQVPLGQVNNISSRRALSAVRANTNSSDTRSQGFRAVGASKHAVNLKFLNQPIYCEQSNREGDKLLIRMLEREEKQRQEIRSTAVTTTANDPLMQAVKILPLSFECSFASCGVWMCAQSELVYAPQVRWTINGSVTFRERDVIVRFESGHSIEFPYASILDITIETGSYPSFIISMMAPPRFFGPIDDPVAALMAELNLSAPTRPQKRNGPSRHRISCIGREHETIAANCLVYRIMLPVGNSDQVAEQMQRLQRVSRVPEIIHHRTRISSDMQHIVFDFQTLQTILARSTTKLPFALKFQIQKLAQNNYLLPGTVVSLLPEITKMVERSSIPICVSVIKKLFTQIPFPGPEVEAEQFEVESIIDLLQSNENNYNKYGISVDELNAQERSENVAIIHKVKVTPCGAYLYGPEPESNNRVLRKYSGHHDYFIRVQFCDEDGQPVRFSSRVSQHTLFHGRFKKVLRDGIKIADRVYSFLGFSHSSLRAQSCWFMAPFVHNGTLMLDRMLISELGDFTVIRSPAKCAARIGQTFSDTPTAVSINPKVATIVEDVQVGARVFSDGVGTMSESVWHQITNGLSRKGRSPPTCFQIRYAGEF